MLTAVRNEVDRAMAIIYNYVGSIAIIKYCPCLRGTGAAYDLLVVLVPLKYTILLDCRRDFVIYIKGIKFPFVLIPGGSNGGNEPV